VNPASFTYERLDEERHLLSAFVDDQQLHRHNSLLWTGQGIKSEPHEGPSGEGYRAESRENTREDLSVLKLPFTNTERRESWSLQSRYELLAHFLWGSSKTLCLSGCGDYHCCWISRKQVSIHSLLVDYLYIHCKSIYGTFHIHDEVLRHRVWIDQWFALWPFDMVCVSLLQRFIYLSRATHHWKSGLNEVMIGHASRVASGRARAISILPRLRITPLWPQSTRDQRPVHRSEAIERNCASTYYYNQRWSPSVYWQSCSRWVLRFLHIVHWLALVAANWTLLSLLCTFENQNHLLGLFLIFLQSWWMMMPTLGKNVDISIFGDLVPVSIPWHLMEYVEKIFSLSPSLAWQISASISQEMESRHQLRSSMRSRKVKGYSLLSFYLIIMVEYQASTWTIRLPLQSHIRHFWWMVIRLRINWALEARLHSLGQIRSLANRLLVDSTHTICSKVSIDPRPHISWRYRFYQVTLVWQEVRN